MRIILIFSLLFGTVATASAQTSSPSAATVSEARELFDRGIRFADDGRWAEALGAFQASLQRVDRASTAFNVANALVRTGRYLEGRAALQAYLARPEIRTDEQKRTEGETLLSTANRSIAALSIVLTPVAATVKVDGVTNSLVGPRRTIELDPGAHIIEVSADGYQPFSRRFQMEIGARIDRTVTLVARAEEPEPAVGLNASAADSSSEANASEDSSIFESPWFWVITGAVVVGGAVTGIVLATTWDSGPGHPVEALVIGSGAPLVAF